MTFSINDKIKFLENLKQGFKRTIFWNKHRSEIITQLKTNNLGCMIDPTFRNVNISFFLFKAGNNDPTRSFFFGYCTPTIEIKDFNVLIDSIPFFD